MENEINQAYKVDNNVFIKNTAKSVIGSFLPNKIDYLGLLKDTADNFVDSMKDIHIQDQENRPLHIERDYTVRVNTIIYKTSTKAIVETRYKVFDQNGKEVFNDSYISVNMD